MSKVIVFHKDGDDEIENIKGITHYDHYAYVRTQDDKEYIIPYEGVRHIVIDKSE